MSLVEALADQEEERARARRINGVVVGVVSNNEDPEGLARVKVTLPWLGSETETDWVKVATFMAGGGRGGFFLPEVGDEVLVSFEHGDIDYPYVLGALWNTEDPPPETNADGKNNVRKIRSRSGHEFVFVDDDEGGQEKVEVLTNAGHKVVLDDKRGQEKIKIEDKTGSNSITIDSVQNSITIESAASLKINAQTIEIEAGATMDIKAGATLNIEANAILNIKGALVKIN